MSSQPSWTERIADVIWSGVGDARRSITRRTGTFATLAVTIALGVGAMAAVLGAADRVLFRPLDVEHGNRMVAVYGFDEKNDRYTSTSFQDYQDFARRTTSLASLSAYLRLPLRVDSGERIDRLGAEAVTPNYFDSLQVVPIVGTTFSVGDGRPLVALISERLWRTMFARDPGIAGRTMRVEGHVVTIAGVIPDRFSGPNMGWGQRPDIWIPLDAVEALLPPFREARVFADRGIPTILMLGRLAAGASVQQATAELDVIARDIAQQNPATHADSGVRVLEAGRARFWPAHRETLLRSFAAFVLVALLMLGLVFSNLTTLLTQQALRRQPEIAIRLALGGATGTLTRQLVAESAALGAGGFVLSIGVASVVQQLLTLSPRVFGVGLSLDLTIDWQVVAFCAALSFALAFLAAAVPFFTLAKRQRSRGLGSSPRTVTASMAWTRYSLVALQVAASAVLLTSALHVARSVMNAPHVDVGFDAAHLTVLSLDAKSNDVTTEQTRTALSEIVRTASAIPGIEAVALSSHSPLDPTGSVSRVRASGDNAVTTTDHLRVDAEYFRALGVAPTHGRAFTSIEYENRVPVAIVNEALARRLRPGGIALGERLLVEGRSSTLALEIVGVVPNIRHRQVWEDAAAFYTTQWTDAPIPHLMIRSTDDAAQIASRLSGALRNVSGDLAAVSMQTGGERVDQAIAPIRAAGVFFGIVSVVALLVAMLGLHATLAYLVEHSRREIALRMALGGAPLRVAAAMVRTPMLFVTAAAGAGLWTAVVLSPLLESQTRNLSGGSGLVSALAIVMLSLCCAATAARSALRATRVPPMLILRGE